MSKKMKKNSSQSNNDIFYRPPIPQDSPKTTGVRRAGSTSTNTDKLDYYITPDIENSGRIRTASPAAHREVYSLNSALSIDNQGLRAGAVRYPLEQTAPVLAEGKTHVVDGKWYEVIPRQVNFDVDSSGTKIDFDPYGIKYAFPITDVTGRQVEDDFMASPKVKNKNAKPSFARFISNQDLLSELIDKPYKYGLSDDDVLKEILGISRKPKISDRIKQVVSRIQQNAKRKRAANQMRRSSSSAITELPDDMQSNVFKPLRRIRPALQEEKNAWREIGAKTKQFKNTAGLANKIDLGARIIEDIGKTRASGLIRKPARMAMNQWDKLPRKAKIGIGLGTSLYIAAKAAQAVDSLFSLAPRAQTNDTKRGMMKKRQSVSQSKKNNKYFR